MDRSFIGGMGVCFHIKLMNQWIGEERLPWRHIVRPWERIRLEGFFAVKPWISAKNFIGAFSGQCDFIVRRHFRTEIKHGRFHVRHTGKVSCIYGFIEAVKHIGIAAFQKIMVCVRKGNHLLDKRPVLAWLECVGFKIFLIICKIKRKRIKLFSLFF